MEVLRIKKINRVIKSNEGSIMVLVLMVFLVIFIATTSVLYLNMTNTRQIVAQRNNIQSYYLAHSGVEIGFAALMTDNEELLTQIVNNTPHTLVQNDIPYGKDNKDKINIIIKYTPEDKNVTIISTGTHNLSNKTTTLTMYYPIDFPSLRTWK